MSATLGTWASDHRMTPEELAAYEARACRVCGCTNAQHQHFDFDDPYASATYFCHWVEADLCSACASNVAGLVVPGVE